jgi:hypothetical protein
MTGVLAGCILVERAYSQHDRDLDARYYLVELFMLFICTVMAKRKPNLESRDCICITQIPALGQSEGKLRCCIKERSHAAVSSTNRISATIEKSVDARAR